MALTTSKNVTHRATAPDEEKARAKVAPAKPEAAKPAEKVEEPEKAEKPAAGKITITGKKGGTVPILAGGGMRRVAVGEPVDVSADEMAYLAQAGISYAKAK